MTKQQAIDAFRVLVARHGICWRADAHIPQAAWDEMREINTVLTERDRREALGFRS